MSTAQGSDPRDHVVVGVDGSEQSKEALRWGRFLADTTGSTLEAVSAWEPFGHVAWAGIGMVAVPEGWDPEGAARAILTETLNEVFGTEPAAALMSSTQEGSAAGVLLEASHEARMLVLGSRGHGGFAGLLLGSVSSACAEHASCPVFVVHGTHRPPLARQASHADGPHQHNVTGKDQL